MNLRRVVPAPGGPAAGENSMRMLNRTIGCLTAAVIAVASAAAWSESAQFTAKANSGPVYNDATKSYFELRNYSGRPRNGWSWRTTTRAAGRHMYKGARGRLAVVDSPETMAFIERHIRLPRETWIGLRLFCHNRQLVWVNGETQGRARFTAWHPSWHRTKIRCGNNNLTYMPIYMVPTSGGYRWQASGPAKNLKQYLVEYPTGRP
jgi:hypothetical protein